MAEFKKQFCGLCLSDVTEKNFTKIEDCTRHMLDVLLPKYEFNNGPSVACDNCWRKLFAASEFKSLCLCTENIIKNSVLCPESIPLDIWDIYKKEVKDKQLVDMLDDKKVCRFCFKLILGEFVLLDEMDPVIFQNHIPEVKLNFTKDPVACKTCIDCFLVHVGFLQNCSIARQTLTENHDDNVEVVRIKNENGEIENTLQQVKTEDVKREMVLESEEIIIKSEEYEDNRIQKNFESQMLGSHDSFESKINLCHQIKDEDVSSVKIHIPSRHLQKDKDASKVKLHKCNECSYETEHNGRLLDHLQIHKDEFEIKSYKCNECDYQTKIKGNLKCHSLKHRDTSEVEMYKCNECDYKTKYKGHLKCHSVKHRDISEVKMYKCDECVYQTKYRRSITRHCLNHRGISDETKHKVRLKCHPLKHKDISEVKLYKCDECEFQTKYRRALTRHFLKHRDATEVKMYECYSCDYKTNIKWCLVSHCLKHRDVSEVKMYKCDVCDYRSKVKWNFTRHYLKHRDISKVKMYKCDECDYQTDYKEALTRHCLKYKTRT